MTNRHEQNNPSQESNTSNQTTRAKDWVRSEAGQAAFSQAREQGRTALRKLECSGQQLNELVKRQLAR